MKRIAFAAVTAVVVCSCSGLRLPVPHNTARSAHAAVSAAPKHLYRWTEWRVVESWVPQPNAKPPLAAASVARTAEFWLDDMYAGRSSFTDVGRTGDPQAHGNNDAEYVAWHRAEPKLSDLPSDPVRLQSVLARLTSNGTELAALAIDLDAIAFTTPELRIALFGVLQGLPFANAANGSMTMLTLSSEGAAGAVDVEWDPRHQEIDKWQVRFLDGAGNETARVVHQLVRPSALTELGKRPE